MPLVRILPCFRGYASPSVDPELSAAIRATKSDTCNQLLSAYLELAGRELNARSFRSGAWAVYVQDFIGAVFWESFSSIGETAKYNAAKSVLAATATVIGSDERLSDIKIPSTGRPTDQIRGWTESFRKLSLNEDRLDFWQGWEARDLRGQAWYPRLYRIHNQFGGKFTRELFNACSSALSVKRADTLPCMNEFFEFVPRHDHGADENSFDDPDWVTNLFHCFYVDYFTTSHCAGLRISVLKRAWRDFARTAEAYFLGKIWTAPSAPLPIPPAKSISGRQANLRTDESGQIFKDNLLTSIPLNVCDSDTCKLLFNTIGSDVERVRTWATERVSQQLKCGRDTDTYGGLGQTASSSPSHDVAWDYLQSVRHGSEHSPKHASSIAKVDFSQDLGLPNKLDLLAYAALLVIAHPAITPSFLETLELCDGDGKLTGLQETDAGHYLVGTKPRRGPELSEQRVLLTDYSFKLVNNLIQSTRILRDILRNRGDQSWRHLFICATSWTKIADKFRPVKDAHYYRQGLRCEFGASSADGSATYLADRFTLSRLRSSCGVLVFLATSSQQRMADALGHKHYSPRLLDHYLPQPIQEFFRDRWIRIFQASIICRAMENSPLILEASSFQTFDQLDEFLRDNALHVQSERLAGNIANCDDSVVFNLSHDVLTVLFSIERAVRQQPTDACGKAHLWSKICERLRPHLRARPDLTALTADAEMDASVELVENLVYA